MEPSHQAPDTFFTSTRWLKGKEKTARAYGLNNIP
jgi:hypothetical protein